MFSFPNITMVVQSVEDISQVQLAVDYIENVFFFLCLAIAIMAIMLIPALMCLSMIDNYFVMKKYGGKIDKEICHYESHYNDKQVQSACNKYLKSYSGFFKNATGLATWNVASLIYIAIGFADFKSGVLEYFNFPFQVINTFNPGDILNSFNQFSWNWYAMLLISLLTLAFFFLGNRIGAYFGRNNLQKRNLSPSLN